MSLLKRRKKTLILLKTKEESTVGFPGYELRLVEDVQADSNEVINDNHNDNNNNDHHNEVYRRLARHSPRAEANIAKACNTMQWSHKIS